MSEEAKAVQEVAKTTGQAIQAAERVGSFFARAMGESVDATAGMLADTLKYKRWERQLRLVDKASAFLKERGVLDNFRKISPKLALPILQGASLEDEEDMHTLWARLLANSMDPNKPYTRSGLSDILRQLEPLDVNILSAMHRIYEEKLSGRKTYPLPDGTLPRPKYPPTSIPINKSSILQNLTVEIEDYWTSVDNLCRLGLCSSFIDEDSIEAMVDEGQTESFDVVTSHGGYYKLCLTSLGVALVKACT